MSCKIYNHLHFSFDLIYLFECISTLYGIFNAKIWFIWKLLFVIITIYSFGFIFNGISSPYGIFNAKIWFIWELLFVIITIYSFGFNADIWFICKCLIVIITMYIFDVPFKSLFYLFIKSFVCTWLYGIKYFYLYTYEQTLIDR